MKPVAGESDRVVEPPKVIENPDTFGWDDSADIVVIGFGASGSSAAIQARDDGADVLIVERFDGGGAAAYSGGVIYAANTRYQKAAGIEDTATEMYKYLSLEVGDAVRPETLYRYCEQSATNLDWLASLGVEFQGSLHVGKTTYPDEDKYLYYSGSETVPANAAVAKPAPRGHRTKARGFSGYALFEKLKAAAYRKGVRVATHSRAMRLLTDRAGAVIGVEVLTLDEASRSAHQKQYRIVHPWRPFKSKQVVKAIKTARDLEESRGVRRAIRARNGVILACGGFSYNIPMLIKYMPVIANTFHALMPNASIGCDGSGMQLGESVGGATRLMTKHLVARQISPPASAVKGLMVNAKGERFINEDIYLARLGNAIVEQLGAKAWLIVDNKLYWDIVRESLPSKKGVVIFKYYGLPTLINIIFGGTKKARTIEALARKCGLPPDALKSTVSASNAAIDAGQPDPAGKNPDYVCRIDRGPYRALNNDTSNPTTFPPFFTLGGLCVDEETGAVLTKGGRPVKGLYAAGRTAVGVCSNAYFSSGVSLQDCVFSGRRAARAARGSKLARPEATVHNLSAPS
jgi:3-oxo-5alpha-steroid 4-dehydrogenase